MPPITPKNGKDLEFLKDLMAGLGYSVWELVQEEIEDMGLLMLMLSEKRADYVTGKEIRKALR